MNGILAQANRRILLGISGGIAAYKSPDIVRRLRELNYEVKVVMTRGATEFITPLTLQAVSGNPVHRDLLDERAEAGMGHIELARWADLILIAPATANCIAQLAGGFATDLLSTVCLATTSDLALAPAMNQQMWQAKATQENVARLSARGVSILGPGDGSQACGEIGPGRMLEATDLVVRVGALLSGESSAPAADQQAGHSKSGPLVGTSVLITAGPTREAIDPVRYISNHSSGKMGYALAAGARDLGARVTLVSGPTGLETPAGVTVRRVTSAQEMFEAVMDEAPSHTVFISAAAVADYAPLEVADRKLKKQADEMTIELGRTKDIVAAVAQLPHAPFTVGFAAETNDLRDNAAKKLSGKGLDMIVGNDVARPGIGFDSENNEVTVLWPGGSRELPFAPKREIARQLLTIVAERFHAKNSTARSG